MTQLETKHISHSQSIFKEAQQIWNKLDLFQSPYFSYLLNGKMNKKRFVVSQRAFYHAVAYFSRPMSVLASRIDSTQARLQIIENIYEEHGEMQEEAFHENTFAQWLNQLDPEASFSHKDNPLIPCVDAFNSTLIGICHGAPVEKGICCLGIIEYMFAYISKQIADAVVKLHWISPENLVHYDLHADLDIKHSKDFFEIIDKLPNPNMMQCIEGLHLGAFIFSRLYNDLNDFVFDESKTLKNFE